MFRNNLKIALRNLWRNKLYTFLNLLGLSVGMTCAFLLYQYVQFELSYDDQESTSVYRMINHTQYQNGLNKKVASPMTSGMLAKTLVKDYPEVQAVSRIRQAYWREYAWKGKEKLKVQNVFFGDDQLHRVLRLRYLSGNPATALKKPYTVVLTKRMAQKLFAQQAPEALLGKAVRFDDQKSYTITGIIDDPVPNTHFKPSVLISFKTIGEANMQEWGNSNLWTYVRLKQGTQQQTFETKLKPLFAKYMAKEYEAYNATAWFTMQPVNQIYLNPYDSGEIGESGSTSFIYIFGAVAFLILFLAAINYINLTIVKSLERAKEISIRKVVGSHRKQLITQLLSESVLFTFIALLVSLSLMELVLPWFRVLSGKPIYINYSDPVSIVSMVAMALLVGVLSGIYPAFFLARFNPIVALRGKLARNPKTSFLRKGLVTFQFGISVAMIIITLGVYQQLNYIMKRSVGYEKENVLTFSVSSDKIPALKNKLRQISGVKSVGSSSGSLASYYVNRSGFEMEMPNGELKQQFLSNYFSVDYDFFSTLDMKLRKGRFFSSKTPSDSAKALIVNETLVKKIGWKEPLGKKIAYKQGDKTIVARVVGVVKDFHITSLHNKIEPAVINLAHRKPYNVYVRFESGGVNAANLQAVQKTYKSLDKTSLYEPVFLDQRFAKQYLSDQQVGNVFMAFSGLAIFIACLGLFGLASYTARQRSKEIGVRKVLGASIGQILMLLSSSYIKLMMIASVLAFPLAYYFMTLWLQKFAYRTSIHWSTFAIAGVVIMLLALLTVSFQSLRAARVNPVEVLKDE